MFQNTFSHRLALSLTLVLMASNVMAQQTVYKWVDADGVVHFGDAPPPNAAIVDSGTIKTTPAPASAPAPKPLAGTSTAEAPAAQKPAAKPAPAKEQDVSEMSIAELDRRCEDARERLIAPEREDNIASCKLEKRNDPDEVDPLDRRQSPENSEDLCQPAGRESQDAGDEDQAGDQPVTAVVDRNGESWG